MESLKQVQPEELYHLRGTQNTKMHFLISTLKVVIYAEDEKIVDSFFTSWKECYQSMAAYL